MKNKFDTIVIGSGIGGLTTAVLLTKIYKKKVLVLEQHFKAGGQTHEFMRLKDGNKYHWDVGVHYIGEMKEGLKFRKIFDFLTDNKLKWNKMPHYFENFIYPDFNFRQPSNPEEYKNDLIKMFPSEEKGIVQYFKDIRKASSWFQTDMSTKVMPAFMRYIIKILNWKNTKLALSTTKDYLDRIFKDKKIKALLTSTWGDIGVPPEKSVFFMHAVVIRSYWYGGYYPVVGASSFAKNMVPIIENGGGKVLMSRSVENIIVKNKTAIGVKVKKRKKEEEYYADNIVSNTGAYNTYFNLLSKETDIPFRDEIKSATSSLSANTLYLGLKESPEKLGIEGENCWIFTSYDHDKTFEESKKSQEIHSAFVSFPSLKNPDAKTHTAEIISFSHFENVKEYYGTKWMKRGDSYNNFKEEYSKKLLEFSERSIPGLSELVDYSELSTPLSLEYFTKWKNGSFYGIPVTPERYKYKWISPKTPIKNLTLTGSDAATIGVVGAMMGGLLNTATIIGGMSMMKIMKEVERYSV
jgi:phytoene dehydrogenase-like protein